MAPTTVPTNAPSDQPTRRALLGMTAALSAVGAAPALAEITGQDPHPAWWAKHQRLDLLTDNCHDWPAFDDMFDRQLEALEQIATTPATTVAGVLAQVNVVRLGIEEGETEFDRDALYNAIATLEQLAGRA